MKTLGKVEVMFVHTVHISSLEYCTLAACCCGKYLGTIWNGTP